MGILRAVKGQLRADELLSRSYAKGRLSHAYLFAGPIGVGRLTAALELAASWMCEEDKEGYCGECRNCVRIFRFQHPDVRLTIPEVADTKPEEIAELFQSRVEDGFTAVRLQGNTRISIAQIRDLGERLSRKAYENKGHIEIIIDAEKMGVEAANALLKTLEEPPDETVIILISDHWSALLPTVRSRSHLVRFRRLQDEVIVNILKEKLGIETEIAKDIAGSSDGRPGVALQKASSPLETGNDYTAEKVLRRISACQSSPDAVDYAGEASRKLRISGSLELCRDMQAFIHDLRRHSLGRKPVAHPEGSLEGFDIDDDSFERGVELFRRAESRLTGNGRPAVVLTAAFTGMWTDMCSPGKDSPE
jgi:DNA polymerase III subunit delta'